MRNNKILGFYDYTVILTYISLCSAVTGVFTAIAGTGHPFIATTCLMISGLCDAFDGMVARKKKDRSELGKKFGIQIDSFVDLIAFGILPCAICYACYISHNLHGFVLSDKVAFLKPLAMVKLQIYIVIFCLYVLAALIRLAYFNVMEEERQKSTAEKRKEYEGLPVTSACLIFPTIILIQYILGDTIDISPLYVFAIAVTGFLFISKIKVKKPGFRGIMIMVAAGAVEFALIIIFRLYYYG
jgi:CDP-diacylglycerol--serine O-phosphatidyltransferase